MIEGLAQVDTVVLDKTGTLTGAPPPARLPARLPARPPAYPPHPSAPGLAGLIGQASESGGIGRSCGKR